MSLLVLSASDVDVLASSLSPEDLQLLMAQVFGRLSAANVAQSSGPKEMGIYMPPRISIPTGSHTTLFMPARIDASTRLFKTTEMSDPTPDMSCTSIKVASVPSKSDPRGLPGTTLVLDESTGGVKAVVNARKLTALRNAAGSLLSTSLVGPSKPQSMITFGAGQQIESHIDLHLRHFPSITRCTIVNRTLNKRANFLQDRICDKFPHVQISLFALAPISSEKIASKDTGDIELHVRSADIIVCATSATEPLFPSAWVKTGAHVILIGSYKPTMHEIDEPLLRRSIPVSESDNPSFTQRLIVDSREACLHEAGELIDARILPQQMCEIGELVPTSPDGHLDVERYRNTIALWKNRDDPISAGFDGPVTIFKSVGIGLQDVAIASAIVNKALSLGEGNIGTVIKDYDI